MKPLNFAVVGCGIISKSHAEAILATEGANLIAACDILPDKLETFCEKYKVPKENAYLDHLVMLEKQKDIDVVCVCVPSGLHHLIAIDALNAKHHVLCEKPLDITKENMDLMIETAQKNDRILAGIVQRRTMRAAIMAKKAVEEGKLGKIVMANAYLKYNRTQEYYNSAGWRGTWELDGGGSLMNQGIHGVDLIQWMVGGIDSLFAYADHLIRDIVVEDTAMIAVKYKCGAFGTIQSATSTYKEEETSFEIYGEKGTIRFGDNGVHVWDIEGEEDLAAIAKERGDNYYTQYTHQAMLSNLVEAIETGAPLVAPACSARVGADIILSIYESAKSGKEVKI